MKLTDLDPRWCSSGGNGITDSKTGEPVPFREKIGIVCDCPKCGQDHPLFVPFSNPFDGGPPTHPVAWTRQPKAAQPGITSEDAPKPSQEITDTFENLTLTPSILRKDCGWHGFITNGEIVTC